MKQIDVSSLTIDPKELKSRLLGANDSETLLKSAEIEKVIREVADCKYDFRETSVKINENTVIFDFSEIESSDLARNLKNCDSAFVVAVTLGLGVDRLLRQESGRCFVITYIGKLFRQEIYYWYMEREVLRILPASLHPDRINTVLLRL